MKNSIILGIVGLIIVGGVVVVNLNPKKDTKPLQNKNTTPSSAEQKQTAQKISTSEVANHNTPEDCWTVVDGKVYDLTAFIAQGDHPAAITESCGTDGTVAFNTRGNKNSPHPMQAAETLKSMYKGEFTQ